MTLTTEEIARQRAAWENECERRAVAAQDAGLPPPVFPDFVPKEGMRFAWLTHDEMANRWRALDDQGAEVLQPMNRDQTRKRVQQLGYVLLEEGLSEFHIAALLRLRKHYGPYWKRHLRKIWDGHVMPFDLRNDTPLMEQLRDRFGQTWLSTFKLPEEK